MQRLRNIALRASLALGLIALVIYASDKPPVSVERVMQSMLMFDPATRSIIPSGKTASGDTSAATILQAKFAIEQTELAIAISTATTNLAALTAVELASTAVMTLDCGWSFENREPAAVNQMAQDQWVIATNINGVLHEDHYVEFSTTPTEAPGMVFEYADLLGESHIVEAITNSYPDLYPVVLPSGVHSCYWFRCVVPAPFTDRLRTWKGPVRFGGPIGSSYGLSIAGMFLIDDGNSIWQGRTITTQIGSNTVEWIKGVVVTPLSAMAMGAETEQQERSILNTIGIPYRAARSFFQPPKVNLTSNTLTKTTWQGTEQYKLAFPIKKKESTK